MHIFSDHHKKKGNINKGCTIFYERFVHNHFMYLNKQQEEDPYQIQRMLEI